MTAPYPPLPQELLMNNDLDQVAAAFTDWRATRGKRGRTPAYLIKQAISLVGKHAKAQITRRPGINNTMLDRWIRESKIAVGNPPVRVVSSLTASVAAITELRVSRPPDLNQSPLAAFLTLPDFLLPSGGGIAVEDQQMG